MANINKSNNSSVNVTQTTETEELIVATVLEQTSVAELTSTSIDIRRSTASTEEVSEAISIFVNDHSIIHDTDSTLRIYESSSKELVIHRRGLMPTTAVFIKYFKRFAKQETTQVNLSNNLTIGQLDTSNRFTPAFGGTNYSGLGVTSVDTSISWDVKAIGKSYLESFVVLEGPYRFVTNQLYEITKQIYLLDFGTLIVSGKVRDFTFYNGGKDPLQVSSIALSPSFGIAIDGLAVGDVIQPYQQLTFNVLAYQNRGALIVNDFFTIHFTNGQELRIYIKVQRVTDFSIAFAPDKNSYSEQYIFKTAVFKSFNNTESRKSLLDKPKNKVSYSITIHDYDRRRLLEHLLFNGEATFVRQPMWSRALKILQPVVGSNIIYCDTARANYEVGEEVTIYDTEQLISVIVKVTNVTQDHIEVNRGVNAAEGSYVIPVKKMKLSSSVTGEEFANNMVRYNITAEEF